MRAFWCYNTNMRKIENDNYIVEVEEIGAELARFYNKKTGIEYIWNADPTYWKGHGPILFPFIGGMTGLEYSYDGKVYPMTKHGIIRRASFTYEEKEDELICTYVNDNPNWPFKCRLIVDYKLVGNKLYINNKVLNDDDKVMYYGFGGHPGINVPLNKDLAFEDYYVEFPEAEKPRQKKFSPDFLQGGPTVDYPMENNRIPLRHDLFDNDAIVIQDGGHRVRIATDKDEHYAEVTFRGFQYCGLWHAMAVPAPYVCVEPWSCMPGPTGKMLELEKKDDFFALMPQSENNHLLTIEIN